MSAMIALILWVVTLVSFKSTHAINATVIPPMPSYAPGYVATTDDEEWELYNQEAYYDYAQQFTELFNSYEVKRAKTGRIMIRRANESRFKFAKMGV